MKFQTLLAGLVSATTLVGSFAANAAETMRFAVTDIAGLENLQREFGAFKSALEKTTGYEVKFFPVNSRTAAVEALNAKQVDFVLTGPAEYVVFKQRANAEVVIGWQRPDYFAQIVVMAEGPIKNPSDLKGKKVSFGSVGSTSQHLGPAQALGDIGLVYGKDYDPQIISRNVAIEALIKGDLQAVGMNFTHLSKIRQAFPKQAFKVIARGRDLPNDILISGAHVSKSMFTKVQTAFVDNSDMLMGAVLAGDDNQKYLRGQFLASIKVSDYDYVRSMYRTIGVKAFDKFVGN